jgi:hypothetical protein
MLRRADGIRQLPKMVALEPDLHTHTGHVHLHACQCNYALNNVLPSYLELDNGESLLPTLIIDDASFQYGLAPKQRNKTRVSNCKAGPMIDSTQSATY